MLRSSQLRHKPGDAEITFDLMTKRCDIAEDERYVPPSPPVQHVIPAPTKSRRISGLSTNVFDPET